MGKCEKIWCFLRIGLHISEKPFDENLIFRVVLPMISRKSLKSVTFLHKILIAESLVVLYYGFI